MPPSIVDYQGSIPWPKGRMAGEILSQIVAGRRLQRSLQLVLSPLELSDSQFLILWMMTQMSPAGGEAGIVQADLAMNLGISPAQISGLVDQLRRRGYLECARSAADRRRQLWQLTVAGREKLSAGIAEIEGLDFSQGEWTPRTTDSSPTANSLPTGEAA